MFTRTEQNTRSGLNRTGSSSVYIVWNRSDCLYGTHPIRSGTDPKPDLPPFLIGSSDGDSDPGGPGCSDGCSMVELERWKWHREDPGDEAGTKAMYSGLLFQTRGPGSQSNYKMAALQHGSRKFYEIPSEELTHFRHSYKLKKGRNIEELLTYIDQSCIGKDVSFSGPYGLRKGKQSIATHILKNTPASGLYIFFCSLLNDT